MANIIELFSGKFDGQCELRKPYIIAEIGVNHEGSIETARKIIDDAAEGGADAVKFQTYKADKIAIKNSPAYWDTCKEPTDSQYKLFQKYDKFWKSDYEKLKSYCDKVEIEFMSTPFDKESATFLNDMVNVFKISSSDITNKPFIEYLCDFRKPIILSTGASYMHEVQEAVEWIGLKEVPVALLHCILSYPTENYNANLGMILDLQKKFPEAVVGYSDHTLPGDMKVLEVATLLGARIIEKHFTHDKSLPGNDHYHAMDVLDLKRFCGRIDDVCRIFGSCKKRPIPSESSAINNARRSLVSSVNICKGQVISEKHLTWKRPAIGISPKYIGSVIGKTALIDIQRDKPIDWNMLS